MARQYQRYSIETFLYCFEQGLKKGCRSVEDIVEYQIKCGDMPKVVGAKRLDDILFQEARGMGSVKDDATISRTWNKKVHPGHERFEAPDDNYMNSPCFSACRLMARWFWRMLDRGGELSNRPAFDLGGSDRMSMAWFLEWIQERRTRAMRDFLRDVFADLVFSQHMRVAISRFDGEAQRLRFMLGDGGIEPTARVNDIAEREIPWMADRLDTFAGLLCDADVLAQDNQDRLMAGKMAKKI